MNMTTLHRISVFEILTKLAGLSALVSDATFGTYLTSLFGSSATQIIAVLGLISVVAGQIEHSLNNSPTTVEVVAPPDDGGTPVAIVPVPVAPVEAVPTPAGLVPPVEPPAAA